MDKRFFNSKDRNILRMISGNVCSICKVKLDKHFHMDHVIPYSKKGPTQLSNSQTLCRQCNLEKKDTLKYDFASRKWQINALNKTVKSALEGNKDFLTNACPGSGKTKYAIAFISWAIETKFIDLVIFCSPTRHLRRQVADELKNLTNYRLSQVMDGNAFEQVLIDGVPNKVVGFSLTYHTMSSRWNVIEALCQRHNLLFIGDEIHHSGLGMNWGDNAIKATAEAKFRLGLSGTPFRSDDNQVAFLRYKDGKGLPQYDFFYHEALKEHYVAPVEFSWLNGIIKFYDPRAGLDTPVSLELKEDSGEGEAIKLRAAFDSRSGYSQALITKAWERLKKIRINDDQAGGLVIASTIENANFINNFINEELKQDSVIVHSEIDNEDKIATFRNSSSPWIVSVGMISEGIDIPRLRILVLLSNKTTKLHFMQAVGRIIRLNKPKNSTLEEFGSVFLPPIVAFKKNAVEFEEAVFHVLGKTEEDNLVPNVNQQPSQNSENEAEINEFFVEEGITWDDGATLSNKEYSQEELNKVEEQFDNFDHPIFKTLPSSAKKLIMDLGYQKAISELNEKD